MNKNIDLILITVGSQATDYHHLPLGILYVGSILKKKGFDVKLHHILPHDIESTVKDVCDRQPIFAGFSVLSGMTTYWTALASEMLKQRNPGIRIVWGGHHATILAEDCLKENYVDAVIRGEGEETSVRLAEFWQEKVDFPAGIAGVSYRQEKEIYHNPDRSLIKDIDTLPLDYELLDMRRYLGAGRVRNLSFFSSRGCPFNCAFCSTPQFFGRSYRTHSSDYVLGHLKRLRDQFKMNSVYFADDNFYLDKERARQIIVEMQETGISCDTVDVRLDQLTEEDLKFFYEHKVGGVFFGWESGNDRLLAMMRKRITTSLIMEKAALISRYGIPAWGSGMMLLPTETQEETRKTIDFSVQLRKTMPGSIIGLFRFMPLPGTELTEQAVALGFKKPTRQQDWKIVDPLENFYRTDWVPWSNTKIQYQLKWVQDVSRSGMSVFPRGSGLKNGIRYFFSSYINRKIAALNFSPIDKSVVWLYQWLERLYKVLR